MVREGRVLISTAGRPAFGVNYSVVAYAPGAEVAIGSSGTVIQVRAGHGFTNGVLLMVGTDSTRFEQVTAVTSTTITVSGNFPVAAGELLINLGADSGTGSPAFDGSTAVIYTDMATTVAAASSTVMADSEGRYRYHHKGIARWEVVRVGTTVEAIYTDTDNPADEDQVSFEVRYAWLFAASGSGTASDPYPGQAILDAWNDIPVGSPGMVDLGPFIYDLGSGAIGLDLDINGTYTTGKMLVGRGGGNEETATVGAAFVNDGATVLCYSGTGEAIRIGDFATSGSSWIENATMRGFKVRQTGTAGNGIGMLARLYRWGRFEDVTFCDFGVGLALASVSDFNKLDGIRIRDCLTYGIDLGRTTTALGVALGGTGGQCNANRLVNCDIMNSNRDNGYANWGVFVHVNTVGNTFHDSEFHNFDTVGSAAIRIDDATIHSNVQSVYGCYFEGCYAGVYHNNPFGAAHDQGTISVRDCYFAQMEKYGVWINSGGAGGVTDGVVILNNRFDVPNSSAPYDTTIGIQLGTYVQNAVVMGNSFSIAGVLGTLPGGNIVHGGLGTITQNNLMIGTHRITGALALDSSLAVGTTLAVTGVSTLTAGIAGGTPVNAGTWVNVAATSGTDTACTNGTAYVGTVKLAANATITGIQYLVGSVGGTTKVVVSLHSSTGALLANSALAGTTVGTAAQLQQVPFTATYAAKGPATYFVALTFDGTTAKFRSIPAYCNAGNGVIGDGVTQTFGVSAAFTPPTAFAADKVPVASLY